MIRKLISKKEMILDAALRLVSKNNTFDITIRQIAFEAGVNVAAINYYFKTKEQLFNEMEKLFMDNFIDAFVPLDDNTLSDDQKLNTWLRKAICYANHYPGILMLLKNKFNNSEASEDDLDMQANFFSRIIQIRELLLDIIKPEDSEADQLFIAFGSCLLFPFISENYVQELGFKMSEDEHLECINLVLNKFKK